MPSTTELSVLDYRLYLRKLRNFVAALVMIAVFVQVFGVPQLRLRHDLPVLELVPLEKPVWGHLANAVTFIRTQLFQESQP